MNLCFSYLITKGMSRRRITNGVDEKTKTKVGHKFGMSDKQ